MYIIFNKISTISLLKIYSVARILTDCGRDMYVKYRLRHWNNSIIKNILILYYTILVKHKTIWGVYNKEKIIGTFQTKKEGQFLNFSKFAVLPTISGNGIGGKCIEQMENIAQEQKLVGLSCEVFDQSDKALTFYLNRGFIKTGTINTLKYTEITLKKTL